MGLSFPNAWLVGLNNPSELNYSTFHCQREGWYRISYDTENEIYGRFTVRVKDDQGEYAYIVEHEDNCVPTSIDSTDTPFVGFMPRGQATKVLQSDLNPVYATILHYLYLRKGATLMIQTAAALASSASVDFVGYKRPETRWSMHGV